MNEGRMNETQAVEIASRTATGVMARIWSSCGDSG